MVSIPRLRSPVWPTFYQKLERELLASYFSQQYLRYEKCKEPRLGFELGSACPFPMTITVTLRALLQLITRICTHIFSISIILPIYYVHTHNIYIYICVCVCASFGTNPWGKPSILKSVLLIQLFPLYYWDNNTGYSAGLCVTRSTYRFFLLFWRNLQLPSELSLQRLIIFCILFILRACKRKSSHVFGCTRRGQIEYMFFILFCFLGGGLLLIYLLIYLLIAIPFFN